MKTLFTVAPHSFVDVITNSSSELFVGTSLNKDLLTQIISELYPDYLNEYQPLKTTKELTIDELDIYLGYQYHRWSNFNQRFITERIPGATEEEQARFSSDEWYHSIVTEDNFDRIVKALDPNNTLMFMFSLDENPDWDMQEKLMDVMNRIHLG